jgi:hypothetical protein
LDLVVSTDATHDVQVSVDSSNPMNEDTVVNTKTIDLTAANTDLTLTELSGEFEMLHSHRDANRFINVNLNGTIETYSIDFNFVNKTQGRKLFQRTGTDIKELYWYNTFGAIMVKPDIFFVTPCGLAGTDLVLVAILETRCDNPHYDALVCNIVTKTAHIIKKVSKWITKYKCDLSMKFDDAAVRR